MLDSQVVFNPVTSASRSTHRREGREEERPRGDGSRGVRGAPGHQELEQGRPGHWSWGTWSPHLCP